LVYPITLDENKNHTQATLDHEVLDGPPDRRGNPTPYQRLSIRHEGTSVAYRVVLIPHRMGDPLPNLDYNHGRGSLSISWPQQNDVITFDSKHDRTMFRISRNGQNLFESK
jgi:hypothetical protein